MSKTLISRYTKRGLKCAIASGVSMGVLASVASAQISSPEAPLSFKTDYFGYAASVSGRVGVSDNINLQNSPNEDSDVFLSTLVTGGAIVSRPRFTAIALGDLDFSYLLGESDFRVNQNLGATSTFTLADNWVYFDLSGSTTRQIVGDNARFSANVNAARNQRVDVHSYSASPYLFRQYSNDSTTELRYRFSQTFIGDNNNGFNTFAGLPLNNSTSQEVLASYSSGNLLDRSRFRLTAYGADTTEDTIDFGVVTPMGFQQFSEFNYQQGSVLADGQYALTDTFSLSGAVGYDEIDPNDAASLFFTDSQLSGFFWRAGFVLRPGPRSNVRIEYGDRYGGNFIESDIRFQISDHVNFNAGAGRTFSSRAQNISSQFRSTQRSTLDFAQQLREGQELGARGLINAANFVANNNFGANAAQSTGLTVSDNAFASLRGVYGRTNLSIRGFYADDDFGFQQVETLGAGINVNRRLNRRVTAYGDLNWRRAESAFDQASCIAAPSVFGLDTNEPLFDPATECGELLSFNGRNDTFIGRIGAGYRLYENASTFLEVSHTRRTAPANNLEFDETSLLVGITLDL